MKLTDAKLRKLAEPGKHFDGGGLYLEVTPAGGRYWRLKYRHLGKEKRLAFGVYPEVSLKLARERRDDARALIERGEDPAAVKRQQHAQAVTEAAATFEVVAREWLAHMAPGWKPGTLAMIRSGMERDLFPKLGAVPIAHLQPEEVKTVIKGVEGRGAGETAGRLLQRVRAVFRYARVHGRLASNPMVDLQPGELLQPRQVRHRPALSEREVPELLAAMDGFRGSPSVDAALRLLLLTALRPGELRGLRWSEVEGLTEREGQGDDGAALLRIPAERMKMKAEHLVPLSLQARELLRVQRRVSGTGDLVFPSPFYPGQVLSENTMNGALGKMGFGGRQTAHGMRAVFSTVCNEAGHDPDVIERQLAHVERNEVRAAYHRAAYLESRAALLQWWADWLDGVRRGGRVVPFKRGRKARAAA